MTKFIAKLIAGLVLITWTSCYTDDSSQVNPDRLPFEDFAGFFLDNNAQADTLQFNADQANNLSSPGGINISIPENAFSASGTISLVIKEANSKSDFLFLDKPTLDGSNWIESSEAISLQAINAAGPVNIEAPIKVGMSTPGQTTIDELSYYNYQNGWNQDSDVEVLEDAAGLSFSTKATSWQMAGTTYANISRAELRVNPVGYGSIPNDMRVFILFKDQSIVLPMEHNVAEVSAVGSVPVGTEIHLVALVMDHFKLSVGTSTITVDADQEIDLQMSTRTVEEMITTIKGLD